jgi:SAM-dependent methyltransferase
VVELMPTTSGQRTPEQIREHYEIEKELASTLRNAGKEERRTLYSALYDEMFRRVPTHPQLTRKVSAADTELAVRRRMRFLKRFLRPGETFMELGPGDCALSYAVCERVGSVCAIDVSDEISKADVTPGNFRLILSDGCSIPVEPGSVDVAYSDQLMEHLHPDDAYEQLKGVFDALAPGGRYVCITPNRLTGPHDVSMYFDSVATGFHLREYSVTELIDLFHSVGFSQVRVYVGARGVCVRFPSGVLRAAERFLDGDPSRRPLSHSLPARVLFNGVRVVATK